ncbi:MAG: SusC/RagA family TonB-linked outer membrane protein, partial [Bacteroidota bacterium]
MKKKHYLIIGLICIMGSLDAGHAQLSAAVRDQPGNSFNSESITKSLKVVLIELGNKYGTDILFMDKNLAGLKVNVNEIDLSKPFETNLNILLSQTELKFKATPSGGYVITNKDIKQKVKSPKENGGGEFKQGFQEINPLIQENSNTITNKYLPSVSVSKPELKVTGTLTDAETGTALIGATVQVKGTTNGTSTDLDGNYSIVAPDGNSILVFSYIGYVNQEVVIGNQTTINVSLVPDVQSLNEVVVVGYGAVRKTDLTGAVDQLQSKDIVRANPVQAARAIQGQVAGATVTKTSNRPGAGYSITIRGENTINNSTQPLVVIDGLMGGDINSINPNDIQSMDVLKDASSTAIYGARGANGVIIITTKKGLSGKPKVSYDSYVGMKVPEHMPRLMNTAEFYKATFTDRVLEGSVGATFTAAETAAIKENRTTDWVDLITDPALQTSQNLSVAGGNDKTTYRFSGGFLNENGNVLYTGFKRYNLNAGLDSKLGERIKVGFTSYITYSDQNVGSQESLRNAYRARPTGTVYFNDLANPSENGDLDVNGFAVWMGINDKQVANPILDIDPKISKYQTTTAVAMANAYAEVTLLKGLTFRSSLSASYTSGRFGDFRGQWSKSQIGNKPRAQVDNSN